LLWSREKMRTPDALTKLGHLSRRFSRNFSLKENKRPSFRGITAMTSRS
jgi:hypothetical protein